MLYKDDRIIIINKPASLASQGGNNVQVSIDSLLDHLKFTKVNRPKLVHRLDKDTSGVMVIARNTEEATKLARYFKDKSIKKTYLAFIVQYQKILKEQLMHQLLK